MNNNTYPIITYPQTFVPKTSNISHNQLKSLQVWWNNLSETWKQVFLANLAIQKKTVSDYNYFRSPWDSYMKSFSSAEDIDNHSLFCISNLSEINCNYTYIETLEPLSKLKNLKEIRCIGSNISSLRPLENLKFLEVLICFDTPIARKERRRFNTLKPSCLILY